MYIVIETYLFESQNIRLHVHYTPITLLTYYTPHYTLLTITLGGV